MKTLFSPLSLLLLSRAWSHGRRFVLGGILLAGTWVRGSDDRLAAPPLKIEVITPPSWSILIDDRIAEWFADGVRNELGRQGYAGHVEELRYPEDPSRAAYLLTLNITEWRLSPAGFVDCTLTATLHTPDGERRLGVYSHSLPRWWGGYGRWGLQRAFEESADSVIADLCRDLIRSDRLPGVSRIRV
jgi:hypothetical protein